MPVPATPTDLTTFDSMPDNALYQVLNDDDAFSMSLINAIPQLGADPGFELFDAQWLNRYKVLILREIKNAHQQLSDDEVLKWAAEVTVSALATLIAQHLGFPPELMGPCAALAVLLRRAKK